MGREIAQVMGPGGIPWLERPEREDEERPTDVQRHYPTLQLKASAMVQDILWEICHLMPVDAQIVQ